MKGNHNTECAKTCTCKTWPRACKQSINKLKDKNHRKAKTPPLAKNNPHPKKQCDKQRGREKLRGERRVETAGETNHCQTGKSLRGHHVIHLPGLLSRDTQ